MNWLETIWDIDRRWGQSTVQKLWTHCTKLYPVSTNPIVSRGHVTLEQLRVYHNFQSKLEDKIIKVESYRDHQHQELWSKWYREIHVSFLDLWHVDISIGSDINTRQKLLITEMSYIEWEDVINKWYWHAIKVLVARAYEEDGVKSSAVSMKNLKIVSFNNGIVHIICTDVFWNIPKYVDELLELSE